MRPSGSGLHRRHIRLRSRKGPAAAARLGVSQDMRTRATAAPTEAALDLRDATAGEDAAAVDDRDRGAQLLQLGQDVAADDDGLAQRAQLAEQLAQLDPGARVQAGGRLVEQQHGRVVDERMRKAETLLHARD